MTETTVSAAEKRLIVSALAVVLLLSALDQTIVATAMPRIIEQLRGLSMYSWTTTAYMLASTVSVPIYGKLSDLYGRKPMLVLGVVLFLTGSALCGLAGEFGDLPVLGGGMTQLIVFRGLQGLGGGALMTVSFAVIADLYPPRERGRMFGVFGSVFGFATIIGPFIGGFFTDHANFTVFGHEVAGWRWVFYVNLPLGMLALFMILYRLPRLRHGTGGRVDYLGAVLLVLTFVPFLLALTLGGTAYAWDSGPIVGLFASAALALVIFLWVEARTGNAIVPLPLFRIKVFRVTTLASFIVSMAFLGIVMFMPLYMQVVQGVTATHSGISLLPLMGGLIVSSILCGRLVARTGRYKPFMIGGGILLIVGVFTLTGIDAQTTSRDLAWRLAITGVGLGPAQTLFSLVIQNSVPMTQVGVASSMAQFSRQIGATVGVAIFGTFLTHSLKVELPRHLPLLPGVAARSIDLEHAQSQAMNVERIREQVGGLLASRYQVIERAYHGDAAAIEEILADTRLPEQVRAPLRDGGVRTRVHDAMVARAESIASGLRRGEAGRDQLLQDPALTRSLREQLANVPARVLSDPTLIGGVIALFRQAVFEGEDALVASATERILQSIRAALQGYQAQLVSRIHEGTREAFASSIAHMLGRALWIVGLGVLIIFFIPEIPLRGQQDVAKPVAE